MLDDAAFGGATPVVPKYSPPPIQPHAGPAPTAAWLSMPIPPNYLIDLKYAVIVEVEASTAIRQAEVTACKTMIVRAKDRFDLRPDRLAADTAYGSAEMLNWLVNDQRIEPHVPVFDKSERTDGPSRRADFAYDAEADAYTCTQLESRCTGDDAQFKRQGRKRPATTPSATAPASATGDICPLKATCCPNEPARKVTRSIHEAAAITPEPSPRPRPTLVSRRERKKVDMLFAHLKRILKLDRLRLRGPRRAPTTSSSSPPPPRTSANSPS